MQTIQNFFIRALTKTTLHNKMNFAEARIGSNFDFRIRASTKMTFYNKHAISLRRECEQFRNSAFAPQRK